MNYLSEEILKNPTSKYRPIPFWSWNEELDLAETKWQINEMHKKGLGGYFMHARGGLQTEYMSKDWMDNIRVGCIEANKKNINAWGYDENGWPSGFAAGKVNALGEKYQQKYLRCVITDTPLVTDETIINIPFEGRYANIYYDINPFYVDLLDKSVTKAFIEMTHEKYKKDLGEDFEKLVGFFTDEPQLSRDGIPWSFTMIDEYKKAYGEDLVPLLIEIFFEVENYCQTRYRFWSLIRDLFAQNYMQQVHEWCQENNVLLTGHHVLEEGINIQLTANSSVMSQYEYYDIPGMDCLGRNLIDTLGPTQVASVSHQLGKKQVLSETFALTGWNASFEDLRWIYEYQMVRGITLLCQHLSAYSLRGIRKRDYPASFFFQQPWWEQYRLFNDICSRIGMLLSEGKPEYDVLVLHPQSSAWIVYNENKNRNMYDFEVINKTRLIELENKFVKLLTDIENEQIQYHLGDERIINGHGKVENYKFVVGEQAYKIIVVPSMLNINSYILTLLEDFFKVGGTIIWSDEIPTLVDGIESDKPTKLAKKCVIKQQREIAKAITQDINKVIITNEENDLSLIYSTIREFPAQNAKMHYIVNSNKCEKVLSIKMRGKTAKRFDYEVGKLEDINYKVEGEFVIVDYNIPACGSVVIFTYSNAIVASKPEPGPLLRPIEKELMKGEWTVVNSDENALPLDYCDCYFDGVLGKENIHINNIQEMANAFKKMVRIDLVFNFKVNFNNKKKLYLVIETPEKFDIKLNGVDVENIVEGYYYDKSFKKIDISNNIILGDNVLKLSISFVQSKKVYDTLEKVAQGFETERNMLTYDTEIEAIYLVGDFFIETDKQFVDLEKFDTKYNGGFTIVNPKNTIIDGDLVIQGLPFFSGKITLCKKINLSKADIYNRSLKFTRLGAVVTKVSINGKCAGSIMWEPYTVDLNDFLVEGENRIQIELIGSLRNLLGPHHSKIGDLHCVCPSHFFENSSIWSGGENKNWDNNYSFVNFGLFF